MSDRVLPKLEPDEVLSQLPSNPTELLTPEQRQDLADDVAQLARLRRDVESASGSLRLA